MHRNPAGVSVCSFTFIIEVSVLAGQPIKASRPGAIRIAFPSYTLARVVVIRMPLSGIDRGSSSVRILWHESSRGATPVLGSQRAESLEGVVAHSLLSREDAGQDSRPG